VSRLGSYRGKDVVKAFQRAGWKIARVRSSHIILEKEGFLATLSVPVHKGISQVYLAVPRFHSSELCAPTSPIPFP
jgi:predicted RNA binding protein YcfA (HicA-like mRNA interferase family)